MNELTDHISYEKNALKHERDTIDPYLIFGTKIDDRRTRHSYQIVSAQVKIQPMPRTATLASAGSPEVVINE